MKQFFLILPPTAFRLLMNNPNIEKRKVTEDSCEIFSLSHGWIKVAENKPMKA